MLLCAVQQPGPDLLRKIAAVLQQSKKQKASPHFNPIDLATKCAQQLQQAEQSDEKRLSHHTFNTHQEPLQPFELSNDIDQKEKGCHDKTMQESSSRDIQGCQAMLHTLQKHGSTSEENSSLQIFLDRMLGSMDAIAQRAKEIPVKGRNKLINACSEQRQLELLNSFLIYAADDLGSSDMAHNFAHAASVTHNQEPKFRDHAAKLVEQFEHLIDKTATALDELDNCLGNAKQPQSLRSTTMPSSDHSLQPPLCSSAAEPISVCSSNTERFGKLWGGVGRPDSEIEPETMRNTPASVCRENVPPTLMNIITEAVPRGATKEFHRTAEASSQDPITRHKQRSGIVEAHAQTDAVWIGPCWTVMESAIILSPARHGTHVCPEMVLSILELLLRVGMPSTVFISCFVSPCPVLHILDSCTTYNKFNRGTPI